MTTNLSRVDQVSRPDNSRAVDGQSRLPRLPADCPFVSIIIPCLNEQDLIDRVLQSITNGTYPADRIEFLVADSGSTDRTHELALKWAERDPRVRIVATATPYIPAKLNAGISVARGSVILKVDAHSLYPANYVEACVAYLIAWGADNVGGMYKPIARKQGLLARSGRFVGSSLGGELRHATG